MFKNPQSDLGWLQSAPPIYRYKTLADILVLTFWRCDKQKSKEETGETAFKYIMSVSVPTGTLQATIWSEQSRAECKQANKKTAHKKSWGNLCFVHLKEKYQLIYHSFKSPNIGDGICTGFGLKTTVSVRHQLLFFTPQRNVSFCVTWKENTWYYFYFVISNNRANIICLHLGLIRYIS